MIRPTGETQYINVTMGVSLSQGFTRRLEETACESLIMHDFSVFDNHSGLFDRLNNYGYE